MVSNASDDLPEPDRPVMTTSLSRGIWMSMFLRLCSRAPLTWIDVSGTRQLRNAPLGSTTPAHEALRRARRLRHAITRGLEGLGPVLQDHQTAQLDDLVAERGGLLELEV